jgi:hypothetical protein
VSEQFSAMIDEARATFPSAIETAEYIVFEYDVPVGARIGERTRIALARVPDWPLSCPPGPHVSPRIGHPEGNVHDSPLGTEWEYWSRPHPRWSETRRTFKDYMTHIRTLFAHIVA